MPFPVSQNDAMNMSLPRIPGLGGDTYLFASLSGPNITLLANALQSAGSVVAVSPSAEVIDERVGALAPQAILLDFSSDQAGAAAGLFLRLRREWPDLPILGTGSSVEPAAMLGALRAGVDDFIDTAAPLQEVRDTMAALLARHGATRASTRGRTIALLGARPGLGVTTLATSLCLLLQEALAERAQSAAAGTPRGVALLDLGLPARDGLLYMDTQSTFSFVDAVHNVRRLDHTLVQTAVARHVGGTAVLSLPSSLAQVREISHADSAALVKRMTDFFGFQIVDLGGFTTNDFIAQTVRDADRTWVVCDQSIGAIVSTANLLRDLRTCGVEPQSFGLVVNQCDPSVGLPAKDIAARLRLPLMHRLPARRAALLGATSKGDMLVRTSRGDPYTVAVLGMVKSLLRDFVAQREAEPAAARTPASPWHAFMSQITGRRAADKDIEH